MVRVSQVRDLHGLFILELPLACGVFERVRVSSRRINRHPDFIIFLTEYQQHFAFITPFSIAPSQKQS